MELLYTLESLRNGLFDKFFTYITILGEEGALLLVVMLVYWCINKKQGLYILYLGLLNSGINACLKLVFRIPRPWVKDSDFTIVEAARGEATGYSFPSGHTQNAAAYLGGIARLSKNKILKAFIIMLILLVALSRMYLGVHTPVDVGVSLVIGLLFVFIAYPFFNQREDKIHWAFAFLIFILLLSVLFIEFYHFPQDVDLANLSNGKKNIYLTLGASLGMVLTYYIDKRYIKFDTKAVWWVQMIKLVVGIALVMGFRIFSKEPLLKLCNGSEIANGIRYFSMMIIAGILWPLSFKWLNKLSNKNN
ncbi:MAG: phosphatase PAP2 family protein [Christensenellaceae bacterium]|nr:phosphatase PAP2 family protein [Christensenellaceae bacterium]